MKNLLYFLCFLSIVGCKKNSAQNPVNAKSAEFTLNALTFWQGAEVTVIATDHNGQNNYLWNWGDEKTSLTGYTTSHKYNNISGIVKITLTINNQVFSKNINVRPGNSSYQIDNQSDFRIYNPTISYLFNGALAQYNYQNLTGLYPVSASNHLSDTLYIYLDPSKTSDHISMAGQVGTTFFANADLPAVAINQHSIIAFNNNTYFYFYTNGGQVKDHLSAYNTYK